MDARAFIALFSIFLLGVVVFFFIVSRRKHPLRDRIEFVFGKETTAAEAAASMLRGETGGRSGLVARITDYTALKLLRAGMSTELRPFFVRLALQTFIGSLAGILFFGKWGLLLGAAAGVLFSYMLVHMKFKRRMARLENDLPTALQFIVNALRAGHALNSALAIVGSEGPQGCQEDFSQLNDSIRLGVPLDKAFQQLLYRTPSIDLRFMSTAMLIQRETGGNLTEILDRLNSVVLDRKRMRGHVKALTGQARMGGYVVGGLPFFLAAGMAAVNPSYLVPMFKTTMGHYLLGGAILLQLLGILVMRKIINIKM